MGPKTLIQTYFSKKLLESPLDVVAHSLALVWVLLFFFFYFPLQFITSYQQSSKKYKNRQKNTYYSLYETLPCQCQDRKILSQLLLNSACFVFLE